MELFAGVAWPAALPILKSVDLWSAYVEPDYEWLMINARPIKVHPHAAGVRGGNQDRGITKGDSTRSYTWPRIFFKETRPTELISGTCHLNSKTFEKYESVMRIECMPPKPMGGPTAAPSSHSPATASGLDQSTEGQDRSAPIVSSLSSVENNCKTLGQLTGADKQVYGVTPRLPAEFGRGNNTGIQTDRPECLVVVQSKITGDKKQATGGWRVLSMLGRPLVTSDGTNVGLAENAEEPDKSVRYHIATRPHVSVEQQRLPGTNLTVPTQTFYGNKPDQTHPGFNRSKTKMYGPWEPIGDRRLRSFTVLSPLETSDGGEIEKAFILGHGQRSTSRPDFRLSSLPVDLVLNFFGQPGKVLVSNPDYLKEKLPFVSVKRDENLVFVKRSKEAMKDPELDTYPKLFKTKIGYLPNFDLTKISPDQHRTSVHFSNTSGVSRLNIAPGLVADRGLFDTVALGSLAVNNSAFVVTPNRHSDPVDKTVLGSIQLIDRLRGHGANIKSMTVYACLSENDSPVSTEFITAMEESKNTWKAIDLGPQDRETLPFLTIDKPNFPEGAKLTFVHYSPGGILATDTMESSTSFAGAFDPLDEESAGKWEIVGPNGEFLENTAENRTKASENYKSRARRRQGQHQSSDVPPSLKAKRSTLTPTQPSLIDTAKANTNRLNHLTTHQTSDATFHQDIKVSYPYFNSMVSIDGARSYPGQLNGARLMISASWNGDHITNEVIEQSAREGGVMRDDGTIHLNDLKELLAFSEQLHENGGPRAMNGPMLTVQIEIEKMYPEQPSPEVVKRIAVDAGCVRKDGSIHDADWGKLLAFSEKLHENGGPQAMYGSMSAVRIEIEKMYPERASPEVVKRIAVDAGCARKDGSIHDEDWGELLAFSEQLHQNGGPRAMKSSMSTAKIEIEKMYPERPSPEVVTRIAVDAGCARKDGSIHYTDWYELFDFSKQLHKTVVPVP